MKTRIVRIGNSQGIRIPKPLLSQVGFNGDVELIVQHGELVIRKSRRAREGWDDAFRQMGVRGEDTLLDDVGHPLSSWDDEQWEWK